jgi:DNA-directed RNA polymerase specialized sigma24 family protein
MAIEKPDWLSEELMKKVSKHARKVCAAKMNFSDMADVRQDLLCDLCKAMEHYDATRGNRNAFLEGVLRRCVKMYVRAAFTKKRGKGTHFELFNDDYCGKADDKWANVLMDRIDLSNAANRLSPEQFQIYTLLKNYSAANAARLLKLPYSSLYLQMQKIHKKIKRAMDSPNILVIEKGANMKDLSLLERLSAKEISELDTGDLMDLSARVAELSVNIKKAKEKLEDAMDLKFRDSVRTGLQMASKDTGTTRFFDGAFQIIAEIPKKVTWDTEKMEKLIKRIPDERRKDIVKISYAIEERKYSALPREYQELFQEARTVTPGKPKFQIILGENQ